MIVSIKVDVDTDRGTKLGVPHLEKLFLELKVPATFLFSLGPDNTGRALKRIFRPGFLKKVSRTSVVKVYGIKTLLNGVLWPGPHIGQRHGLLMRATQQKGFEVGIHAYDHHYWQDYVSTLSQEQIWAEFNRARSMFQRVFGETAKTAGAPGWQANEKTLRVYDEAQLLYGSDCRGTEPFFPKVGDKIFKTLQIPTTLPTLDELIGRPEYPTENLVDHYLSLLKNDKPNVFTIHAELEGMHYLPFLRNFITACQQRGVIFQTLEQVANQAFKNRDQIPICEMYQGSVDGRSGELAMQSS